MTPGIDGTAAHHMDIEPHSELYALNCVFAAFVVVAWFAARRWLVRP